MPSAFIVLYNNEMYNGITGIAELACVTSALLTETYALQFTLSNCFVISKAVASKWSFARPIVPFLYTASVTSGPM